MFLVLVHGLVDEQDLTGQPGRRHDPLLEIQQDVIQFLLRHPFQAIETHEVVDELDHRVTAVTGDRRLPDGALRHVGAITRDVIPDRFQTIGRNRKWKSIDGVGHAVAALDQLCGRRDPFRGLVDTLRERRAATRLVDVHLVAGIGLQQRLVSYRQDVRVLRHVGGGYRIQDLVIGERIGVVTAGLEVGNTRLGGILDAAFPGRDGAGLVTGSDGAQRCQILAETGRLVRRNLGQGNG